MHALLIGAPGVGKSTLIRRVLAELNRPVFGFVTKKEDALADGEMGSPIYIYKAGEPHIRTKDNLAGYCKDKRPTAFGETFDRFALHLNAPVPAGDVVVMDEIGTMETSSKDFCSAVLKLLDGDAPVIAAVKNKDKEFLKTVRSHPNAVCFHITEENREALYEEVLAFIKKQL